MSANQRILIVGGVAGGASCATRARRLSESAQIILFERGPFVSFANCGLPYHIGNIISKEENLLVATPELFEKRFNIDVRLQAEVIGIDIQKRQVQVKDLTQNSISTESYDALVLSPGANPIRPDLPGINLPGIFSLRTIPDSRRIRHWISTYHCRRAVVVGGGYIGMEMMENLHKLGLKVTVIEKQSQVMPLLDPEMALPIQDTLIKNGIDLHLNERVLGFSRGTDHTLLLNLKSGGYLETDLVILCIGVQPETSLAKAAGLKIGSSGGIWVDSQMRTSDPFIWAVGDATEVRDAVTGEPAVIPLAGPANRQGRIAADVIMGRGSAFRGTQGTSVVGIMDQVVAFTGPSEKRLRHLGRWNQVEKIYLHPNHHAGYYPGANPICFKLIFSKRDGRIISAQAVGKSGVEKRIDVISMAIQKEGTVFDLEEAELCYAPQYGSAKDALNHAGMIAANILRGDFVPVHWEDIVQGDAIMLDVRDPAEFKRGRFDGARNLPLDQLRQRMDELDKEADIWTYCFVGQRSYFAARILSQNGFKVKNISGGLKQYRYFQAAEKHRKPQS